MKAFIVIVVSLFQSNEIQRATLQLHWVEKIKLKEYTVKCNHLKCNSLQSRIESAERPGAWWTVEVHTPAALQFAPQAAPPRQLQVTVPRCGMTRRPLEVPASRSLLGSRVCLAGTSGCQAALRVRSASRTEQNGGFNVRGSRASGASGGKCEVGPE